MPKQTLTARFVETVKIPSVGARVEYWDDRLEGFGLRVTDKGSKTFFVMPRLHGKRLRIKIGRYPRIGLAEARKLAADALNSIDGGNDPRLTKAPPGTLKSTADNFVALHLRAKRSAGWADEAERLLTKEIIPHWGARRLSEISPEMVEERLKAIVARSGYTANRTLAVLRKMFKWAKVRPNPCTDIEKPGEEVARDRVLKDPEIRAIWNASLSLEPVYGGFVRMMFMTAQRRGEVVRLRWQDIDEHSKLWVIPREFTKADRAQTVPLTDAAIDLVRGLPNQSDPELPGCDWIFTSTGSVPLACFSDIKNDIDEVAKVSGWRLHDIRRTVATNMQRLGVQDSVIEAVLNHAPQGVTRKHYALSKFDAEKAAALKKWGERLDAIIKNQTAEVIPLRA
ncbi:MAG: site-specific integrase [Micropepsaceae bacterium]